MKQWMMALMVAAMLVVSTNALAESAPERKVDDAITVVRQFVDIPENEIPPTLLRQAYGIAVIPSVFKAGFIFGGRHGSGLLSVRTQDGSWSNPVFITLTGASVGWQIGASSSDLILVFKTKRSVDKIANGQFSLGADAAVAAGPVGRSAGASTNGQFDAEVYSYSRARGLFAGVSLEGGHIGIDQDNNWLFYNKAGLSAYDILRSSDDSQMPKVGQQFVYTLDRYMPPADNFGQNPNGNSSTGTTGGAARDNDQYGQGQTSPYKEGNGGVTVQQGNYDPADNDAAGGSNAGYGSSNGGSRQSSGQNNNQNTRQTTGKGDYGSGAQNNYQ